MYRIKQLNKNKKTTKNKDKKMEKGLLRHNSLSQ